MKKDFMMKQKNCIERKRKGFSLSEVLVVVVLIIILSGLGVIEVIRYQRNLKQLELDGMAKEIFVAAQNNLSLAVSQGYLGREDFGTEEPGSISSGDSDVWYYTVCEGNTGTGFNRLGDGKSALGLLLPQNSIDETVRTGGSYFIRYQKSTGHILDVFYAEPGGKFGITLQGNGMYSELMGLRGGEAKESRRNYGEKKAVVGYYGGVSVSEMSSSVTLTAPSLEIVNAEKLSVKVIPGDASDMSKEDRMFRLIITGEQSGASTHFDSNAINGLVVNSYMDLDDITVSGGHFAEKFAAGGFFPGENLIMKAQVCALKDGIIVQTAESTEKTTNSLFADVKTVTIGDGTTKQAVISNIRHLENLGYSVSGFNGTNVSVTGAVQTTDLTWKEFTGSPNVSTKQVFKNGASEGNGEENFVPVTPAASLDYDGESYKISGVQATVVASAEDAGLFGSLAGGSVRNLFLVDFNIAHSTDGDAGALAGYLSGTEVSGVLAYNDTKTSSDDSSLSISSVHGNAGGLIGSMSGGSVTGSAAALYVKAGAAAGGLVGNVTGAVVIDSCYSGGHTKNARFTQSLTVSELEKVVVNVQGGTAAGGLVGIMSGAGKESAKILSSYTTSSVYTESDTGLAGGLVADISAVGVMDCYAANYVSNHGTAECYAGNGTGCTFTGKNYYLTNLSPRVPNSIENALGISGKDTAHPEFIFVGEAEGSRKGAYIYDDTLKVEYGGLYYFPTVEQLGGVVIEGITDVHYGDWQVPFLDTLSFAFENNDKLYLDIIPDDRQVYTVLQTCLQIEREIGKNQLHRPLMIRLITRHFFHIFLQELVVLAFQLCLRLIMRDAVLLCVNGSGVEMQQIDFGNGGVTVKIRDTRVSRRPRLHRSHAQHSQNQHNRRNRARAFRQKRRKRKANHHRVRQIHQRGSRQNCQHQQHAAYDQTHCETLSRPKLNQRPCKIIHRNERQRLREAVRQNEKRIHDIQKIHRRDSRRDDSGGALLREQHREPPDIRDGDKIAHDLHGNYTEKILLSEQTHAQCDQRRIERCTESVISKVRLGNQSARGFHIGRRIHQRNISVQRKKRDQSHQPHQQRTDHQKEE